MSKRKYNGGNSEIGFGMMIVLGIIALFIIWYFNGGPQRAESQKPFIKPYNSSQPLRVYGPGEQ
jgi:hypothetical protein